MKRGVANSCAMPCHHLAEKKCTVANTKDPDVIRHVCGHRWCSLLPSETNRTVACVLSQRQLLPQTHRRSGPIVEGVEDDDPLLHALAVFAEARRLVHQRCQGLTQGQVHPFDQGWGDRETQLCQAFGAKHDVGTQRQ
jgi:hypothetical protein